MKFFFILSQTNVEMVISIAEDLCLCVLISFGYDLKKSNFLYFLVPSFVAHQNPAGSEISWWPIFGDEIQQTG